MMWWNSICPLTLLFHAIRRFGVSVVLCRLDWSSFLSGSRSDGGWLRVNKATMSLIAAKPIIIEFTIVFALGKRSCHDSWIIRCAMGIVTVPSEPGSSPFIKIRWKNSRQHDIGCVRTLKIEKKILCSRCARGESDERSYQNESISGLILKQMRQNPFFKWINFIQRTKAHTHINCRNIFKNTWLLWFDNSIQLAANQHDLFHTLQNKWTTVKHANTTLNCVCYQMRRK